MEVEMTGDRIVKHQGISLRVDWRPGAGKRVEDLPTTAGIYAEIYWPERGVRIGETGRSVRGKIRHDIRWFESMKSRTAPVAQGRHRRMAKPLQHRPTSQRIGLETASSGNHRSDGPEAGHALTIKLDHSMGADHAEGADHADR